MCIRRGARPTPPATTTAGRSAGTVDQPRPKGPRRPSTRPTGVSTMRRVVAPTALTVSCQVAPDPSPGTRPDTEIGTSPTAGLHTMANWPAWGRPAPRPVSRPRLEDRLEDRLEVEGERVGGVPAPAGDPVGRRHHRRRPERGRGGHLVVAAGSPAVTTDPLRARPLRRRRGRAAAGACRGGAAQDPHHHLGDLQAGGGVAVREGAEGPGPEAQQRGALEGHGVELPRVGIHHPRPPEKVAGASVAMARSRSRLGAGAGRPGPTPPRTSPRPDRPRGRRPRRPPPRGWWPTPTGGAATSPVGTRVVSAATRRGPAVSWAGLVMADSVVSDSVVSGSVVSGSVMAGSPVHRRSGTRRWPAAGRRAWRRPRRRGGWPPRPGRSRLGTRWCSARSRRTPTRRTARPT